VPHHEVVSAARQGDPLVLLAADTARRQALAFPPFGGLAELRGAPEAVTAACEVVAGAGVTVLGPGADGTSALLRAPSFAPLCDALALPGIDAARGRGRLRIDVDPRRV
jgi:primosomal protein N'